MTQGIFNVNSLTIYETNRFAVNVNIRHQYINVILKCVCSSVGLHQINTNHAHLKHMKFEPNDELKRLDG